MDRRTFVKNLGLGAVAASVAPIPTVGAATLTNAALPDPYEVVVVGGGFGGASVAKYLKLWGQNNVNVTLVDTNSAHVSCILSNLVLNGQKSISNLTFNLATSAAKNNFTFKAGKVVSIDKELNGSRYISLSSGEKVYFDKLVMSPGVDFDYPEGMTRADWNDSNTPFPHAWKAGEQTINLRNQLNKLPRRGKAKVVLTIPKSPYRCPPGPYERACLIADYLKNRKGGGKLIIFDANSSIQAEPVNFGKAFTQLYGNIISYIPNRSVVSVSGASQFDTQKSITVTDGVSSWTETRCQLINVIPTHKAPQLLFDAGLVDSGKKWAGVRLDTYQSLFDNDIYVIGDAHESIQPKAGHIANSEAKNCADGLIRDLGIREPRAADAVPVTNSACYSPITSTTASFLTAGYRFNPADGTMVKDPHTSGEAEHINSDNYKMMLAWANNLFSEVF